MRLGSAPLLRDLDGALEAGDGLGGAPPTKRDEPVEVVLLGVSRDGLCDEREARRRPRTRTASTDLSTRCERSRTGLTRGLSRDHAPVRYPSSYRAPRWGDVIVADGAM